MFKSLIPMDANYKCCHHTANVQHHLLIWTRLTPMHFAGIDGASICIVFKLAVLAFDCVCGTCPSYFYPPLTEVSRWMRLRSSSSSGAGTDSILSNIVQWLICASHKDQTLQAQFLSHCTSNMELSTFISSFANHQPSSVPGWTSRVGFNVPPNTL